MKEQNGGQMWNNFECHLTIHRHLQNHIWLSTRKYLSGLRCERTGMPAKCKLFVTVT